jgi:predicted metalloprotease with PDZ domain
MRSHLLRHTQGELVVLLLVAIVGLVVGLGGCQSAATKTDTTFEQMIGTAPGAHTDTASPRRGALWYHIEATPERLQIHVRLADPPERASFFLPGSWAGRSNFAHNISIQGAVSEDGPVPFTISRSEGRIDVESQGARWVQLRYSVRLRSQLENLERFHPQFVDGVLFAYGPAFIVLPSEQISRQVRDIPIEVRAPSAWRLMSTWNHVSSSPSQALEGSTVHGFVAPTPAALRDAYVAAGAEIDVRRPAATSPGSPLSVGFSPGLKVDRDAYSRHVATLVDAYRTRFGDLGAVTAYVRAVDAHPLDRGRGVGRRGGFVVEIPADQPIDDKAMLLLAHEAFHLWNGHHLTPDPAAEKETRWFKEGVTHYVALKVLAELGLFTRDDVLRELSRAASYYQRNPASRGQPSSKADRARLPYDKGVLLAVALDAALVAESKGRVGLEAWVRVLVDNVRANHEGQRGGAYDVGDLRAALVQVAGSTGPSALEIWESHITNANALNPSQIFDLAGLHWLEGTDRNKARLLPVKRAHNPFQAMFPPPD